VARIVSPEPVESEFEAEGMVSAGIGAILGEDTLEMRLFLDDSEVDGTGSAGVEVSRVVDGFWL
jgi:hypothetical protein